MMKMPRKKKSGVVADKALNLLRLALLWARKVGRLKVKRINGDHKEQIRYWERQLSFDRTPDHRALKKDRSMGSMRFLFPCVGAKEGEFKYDFDADGVYGNGSRRESYLTEEEEETDEEESNRDREGFEKKSQFEEEGIDSRAEKFIAEFYDQMKFRN
ncbi:hypothetical protein CCACVL1_26777 [Corchorus capsularis]|uniref:Uncharacterized protein n=1 Tax=Corchorus capsularis TaxID=210143 RepID=A0A1R3GDD3_COCAP|nr:hypothetical protein CCACVL1_26777 [Corchorus capsularis]